MARLHVSEFDVIERFDEMLARAMAHRERLLREIERKQSGLALRLRTVTETVIDAHPAEPVHSMEQA
jgi:hypothetical protein